MPERKVVTVMADYGAFPVWVGTGGFMIRPEALPLPDDLRTALGEWSTFYDDTLSSNGYEWPSKEIERDFADRGRVLARQVASALGDPYEVLYFNDETDEREAIPGL